MRVPKQHSSDERPVPEAATPQSSSDDLTALLASLEEQERATAQRRAEAEKALYDDGIARAKVIIASLAARGHQLSQIAKALGLATKPSSTSGSSCKASGPNTNQGWFQLFRSRGLQVYLRAHPDLATSLKENAFPSAEYASHIPAEDLKHIDAEAHSKADRRCPAASAAS